MQRTIRYQGAIVKDDHVLLIRYRDPETDRSFWMMPGGGLEPDESEEECVRREMHEETSLRVVVERLLLEDDDLGGMYQWRKTYLCLVEGGTPSPGIEPEFPVPDGYGIVETGWFHLGQPESWGEAVRSNSITHELLKRIQASLGYPQS